MSSGYKLIYFNAPALAEPARFLFHYGGIDFEDYRLANHEEFLKLKPSLVQGKVPVLEFKGKQIGESTAISRYIGKLIKLGGNDDLWEDLEIDSAVDIIIDLRGRISSWFWNPDEASKNAQKEKLLKDIVPDFLGRLEKLVVKNNGHLALGRLTWADIFFAGSVENLEKIDASYLKNYPNLTALKDSIWNHPNIKKYLENRPPKSS